MCELSFQCYLLRHIYPLFFFVENNPKNMSDSIKTENNAENQNVSEDVSAVVDENDAASKKEKKKKPNNKKASK